MEGSEKRDLEGIQRWEMKLSEIKQKANALTRCEAKNFSSHVSEKEKVAVG